jgi:hypothetical protein
MISNNKNKKFNQHSPDIFTTLNIYYSSKILYYIYFNIINLFLDLKKNKNFNNSYLPYLLIFINYNFHF